MSFINHITCFSRGPTHSGQISPIGSDRSTAARSAKGTLCCCVTSTFHMTSRLCHVTIPGLCHGTILFSPDCCKPGGHIFCRIIFSRCQNQPKNVSTNNTILDIFVLLAGFRHYQDDVQPVIQQLHDSGSSTTENIIAQRAPVCRSSFTETMFRNQIDQPGWKTNMILDERTNSERLASQTKTVAPWPFLFFTFESYEGQGRLPFWQATKVRVANSIPQIPCHVQAGCQPERYPKCSKAGRASKVSEFLQSRGIHLHTNTMVSISGAVPQPTTSKEAWSLQDALLYMLDMWLVVAISSKIVRTRYMPPREFMMRPFLYPAEKRAS